MAYVLRRHSVNVRCSFDLATALGADSAAMRRAGCLLRRTPEMARPGPSQAACQQQAACFATEDDSRSSSGASAAGATRQSASAERGGKLGPPRSALCARTCVGCIESRIPKVLMRLNEDLNAKARVAEPGKPSVLLSSGHRCLLACTQHRRRIEMLTGDVSACKWHATGGRMS